MLNTYDENGYLTRLDDQDSRLVWEALTENARGQILTEKKGTKTTTYAYDSRGLPSSIQAPGIVNLSYDFTDEGNLLYREDNLNYQKEVFAYDELNRLTGWDIYDDSSIPNEEHSIVYHPTTGNIESKTDLRTDMEACPMSYGVNGKPHALAGVSNAPDYISAENLTVTYADFRKINTLTEGNKTYTLTYGVDDQRRKSVFTQGAATTTRYYLGDYEEVQKSDGTIQKIHYLRGGSMMLQQGATKSLYYGYHDYQGSLIVLTNQSGTVVERRAYDPWGRHRNPQSWTDADYTSTSWLNNRGYTGHEHLDAFQIINMNGRVYDPLTAQFFSPDPFVQAPDNWLNYNRYGYCLNNPLIYTDPSGESFLLAIAFGVFINVSQGILSENINSAGDFFLSVGIGALSGAAGGFAGQAAAGALGISSTLGGSMLNGAISGAVGGFSGGFVSGAGNAWVNGASFTDGLNSGLVSGGYGALGGAVVGGITGGVQHLQRKAGFARLNPQGDVPTNPDGSLERSTIALEKFSDAYLPDYVYSDKVDLEYNHGAVPKGAYAYIPDKRPADGIYKINFADGAFRSKYELFLTMGHEYNHVANFINGLYASNLTEYAAYMWESITLSNSGWNTYSTQQSNLAKTYFNPDASLHNAVLYRQTVIKYTNYSNWGIPMSVPSALRWQ